MKYVFYALFALFFFTSAPALADDNILASVFFSTEELSRIAATLTHDADRSSSDRLHLGAIIYSSPDDWSLWLQGERWTPATTKQNIRIVSVNAEQVRLSLALPRGAVKEVTLHPHQTYRLSTSEIIEGD